MHPMVRTKTISLTYLIGKFLILKRSSSCTFLNPEFLNYLQEKKRKYAGPSSSRLENQKVCKWAQEERL